MFTNLAMVIYLADVADSIKNALEAISVFGLVILIGVIIIGCIEGFILENKRSFILALTIAFIILFTSILIPNKNTIYLFVGGVAMDKGVEEIAKSKYPKELQKTFDNLLNKINKELESDNDK